MEEARISRAQYLQVVGLLALAERHTATLDDIATSLRIILNETDDSGWISDAVHGAIGGFAADTLLKKMNIEVDDGPQG